MPVTLAQLKTALISDTHRDYGDTDMSRYIAQGEGFIRSRLKAYGLSRTLTDADRSDPTSGVYTLPARLTLVRFVYNADGMPLDQVDENLAWQYRSAANALMFAVRPSSILVAGVPGVGATLSLHYMGVPDALVGATDTNALLTDYTQLYLDAAAIWVHRRAQDYESAQLAQQSAIALIRDINSQIKKQLGGARAVPAYNVRHRSAY